MGSLVHGCIELLWGAEGVGDSRVCLWFPLCIVYVSGRVCEKRKDTGDARGTDLLLLSEGIDGIVKRGE